MGPEASDRLPSSWLTNQALGLTGSIGRGPLQAARRQGGTRAQQVEIPMVTTLHVPCLLPL